MYIHKIYMHMHTYIYIHIYTYIYIYIKIVTPPPKKRIGNYHFAIIYFVFFRLNGTVFSLEGSPPSQFAIGSCTSSIFRPPFPIAMIWRARHARSNGLYFLPQLFPDRATHKWVVCESL
jgi:hypothetical protein